jgi:hypothetical protein
MIRAWDLDAERGAGSFSGKFFSLSHGDFLEELY